MYDLDAGEKGGREKGGEKKAKKKKKTHRTSTRKKRREREQTFFEAIDEQLNLMGNMIPEADRPSPKTMKQRTEADEIKTTDWQKCMKQCTGKHRAHQAESKSR